MSKAILAIFWCRTHIHYYDVQEILANFLAPVTLFLWIFVLNTTKYPFMKLFNHNANVIYIHKAACTGHRLQGGSEKVLGYISISGIAFLCLI